MRQNVLDQSAGPAAMVGGGSTRPRPPVLTPRGAGDRQPSDPSRRTPPGGPPTRDASDVGSQSPRTSNRRDTCHKVITDHCRFLGRCPFSFWIGPRRKETEPEATETDQAQTQSASRNEAQGYLKVRVRMGMCINGWPQQVHELWVCPSVDGPELAQGNVWPPPRKFQRKERASTNA